jgi:hypothetical protein
VVKCQTQSVTIWLRAQSFTAKVSKVSVPSGKYLEAPCGAGWKIQHVPTRHPISVAWLAVTAHTIAGTGVPDSNLNVQTLAYSERRSRRNHQQCCHEHHHCDQHRQAFHLNHFLCLRSPPEQLLLLYKKLQLWRYFGEDSVDVEWQQ